MAEEKTTQTVLDLGGWTTRTVIYVALALFLIGVGLGAWGYHTWTHSDWLAKLHELENRLTAEKNKPPVIKEVVRTQTQTEIAYVPKETVKYINSKTGEEVTAKELESMNINIRPTEFQFSVNGNPAKFIAEKGEKWVFDQNKGKLDQWSQASINIQVPVEDRTRRTSLIPSGLYDADKKKIQPGGILVQQFGKGRIGPAGQVGAFGGGHYTFGVGGSF
ncbi:MAG: hypothetical protein AB9917_13575 [Negativicutes bacterium]